MSRARVISTLFLFSLAGMACAADESSLIAKRKDVEVRLVGPPRIKANTPATYTVKVRNLSDAALPDVSIVVELTSTFKVSGTKPAARATDGRLEWRLELPQGKAEYEVSFDAVAQAGGKGNLRAYSPVSASVENPAVTVSRSQPPTAEEPKPPALSLPEDGEPAPALPAPTKEDVPSPLPAAEEKASATIRIETPTEIIAQQKFFAKIEVTNSGNARLTNGGLSFDLTKGMQLMTPPKTAGSLELDPGKSMELTLELSAESAGVHGIRATLEADGIKEQGVKEFNVAEADFGVTIEAPRENVLGSPFKLKLYVANNRKTSISNIRATVAVPPNFEVVSGEEGATFNRRTRLVTWRIGSIGAEETRGFRLTLRPTSAGEVNLVGAGETSEGRTSQSSAPTKVLGHTALGVDVSTPVDLVEVDSMLSVSIELKGKGTQPARNVAVRVDRMPGFELDPAASSRWTEEQGYWEYKPGIDIGVNQQQSVRLGLKAVNVGSQSLRVVVIADEMGGEVIRQQPLKIMAKPGAEFPTPST